MHVLHVTSTLILSIALAARGSPLPRVATRFHILTGTAPSPATGPPLFDDEVCDDAQVAYIKEGIADAKKAANTAIKALKTKNVEKSNGFFWMFGEASASSLPDISRRFDFVNRLDTPDSITSADLAGLEAQAQEHVVFTCIPAARAKALANTVNAGRSTAGSNGTPKLNFIRFAAQSLSVPDTMEAAAARGKSDVSLAFKTLPTNSKIKIPPLAFIFVHEVQHQRALLDNPDTDHFKDINTVGSNVHADGLKATQFELTAAQKQGNPQNYAWFSLFIQSNPEFFSPTCKIDTTKALGGVTLERRGLFGKAKAPVKPPSAPVEAPVKAPAKAPASPAAPAKAPTAPEKVPVASPAKVPATQAKPPAEPAAPASPPTTPARAPATPPKAAAPAASEASAASCSASSKTQCAACAKIVNGIPGDVEFTLGFTEDED